jgi:hypothetical protein
MSIVLRYNAAISRNFFKTWWIWVIFFIDEYLIVKYYIKYLTIKYYFLFVV